MSKVVKPRSSGAVHVKSKSWGFEHDAGWVYTGGTPEVGSTVIIDGASFRVVEVRDLAYCQEIVVTRSDT